MKDYTKPSFELLQLMEEDIIMASADEPAVQPQKLRYFGVGDVGNWQKEWE